MDIPLHKNESAKKFKRDWNKIAESQFQKQFKNFVQEPEPVPQVEEVFIDKHLTNEESYFTGTLYLGSQKQPMHLDFDTGSSVLNVQMPEDLCWNCVSHNRYEPRNSTTAAMTSSKSEQLHYGSASLTVWHFSDSVCLDEHRCL